MVQLLQLLVKHLFLFDRCLLASWLLVASFSSLIFKRPERTEACPGFSLSQSTVDSERCTSVSTAWPLVTKE